MNLSLIVPKVEPSRFYQKVVVSKRTFGHKEEFSNIENGPPGLSNVPSMDGHPGV